MAVVLTVDRKLSCFDNNTLPLIQMLKRVTEERDNMAVSFRATFPDFIGVKLSKHKHDKKRKPKKVKPKPKRKPKRK